MNLIDLNGETIIGEDDTFVSVVVLEGECTYEFNSAKVNLKKGASVFIPAILKISINGKAKILKSMV